MGKERLKEELHKSVHQVNVTKSYKPYYERSKSAVNKFKIDNILNRDFTSDRSMKVVASDLTYVRVKQN